MKFFVALAGLLGLAASVTAQFQGLAQLPPCATSCILSNLNATTCSLTDVNCICHDQKLTEKVAECSLQKCTVREGLTAQRVSAEQCGIKPRDRSGQIKAIVIACMCTSWVFYLTRMATRTIFNIGVLGLDDLFLTIAMATTVVGLISSLKMANAGLGKDIWVIDLDKFDEMLLWYFIGEISYVWLTSCLKLSLLFFFLRIFNSTDIKKWIYAAIVFQALFILTFTIVIIFQCTPISYAWLFWDGQHSGTCVNINTASWSIAAITIALDIIVLTLPIRELWRLKMNRMKKIYVLLMFGLGFFVTIVSILRLQTLVKFSKTYNLTYDNFPAVYWSSFEGSFGTVALCLPTVRPFLGAIAPRIFGTVGPTTKSSSYNLSSRISALSRRTRRRENTPLGAGAPASNASDTDFLPPSAGTHHSIETFGSEKRPQSNVYDGLA